MRSSAEPSRREFLAAAAAGSIAGYAWPGSTEFLAPLQRGDYLFAPGLVYLSTATLGPCPRRVVEQTQRAWYAMEASPSAMAYGEGEILAAAERVRANAASFLGCDTDEIAITRSTTDGMNAIAQGIHFRRGDRVLTTDQEHEGGSSCWLYAAKHFGVEIDTIRIGPDEHDAAALVGRFEAAITSATRVISVSHILSSTGLRMPIPEISALARSRGVLCVVDGAQSAGSVAVNVRALGCHAYATSGHKWLMAPKGTGLLYLAKGTEQVIEPIQFADGRAYYSHSSGVGNLAGVVGLGVALDLLRATNIQSIERHNLGLRNALYNELGRLAKVTVVSAPPGPLATPVVTFRLPDQIDSQILLRTLRENHKVIVKMVPKRWLNGIRLSPHIFNTEADVAGVLSALRAELN